MSETKIDDVQVRIAVNKLMDKAGQDKRLTPRLLREKAEMKMKLAPGALKCKRARIKVMIFDWWSKNVEPLPKIPGPDDADVDPDLAMLRNIAKYAKAVGKGPNFFKDLGADKSNADKSKVLRKRLRDDGVEVPYNPTSAEIDAARKAFELKKEALDIDPKLIIEGKRRGGDNGSAPASTKEMHKAGSGTESTVKVKSEVKTEKSSAAVGQKRPAPSAADEEEEADF
jgi:hypothetical protein